MNVVLFPAPLCLDGLSPEHRAFCLARQAMNQRFVAWLRAEPNADFDSELGPTLDVLRQLRDLEQMP